MAKNKNSSYTIELDVTSSAASKQTLKEFRDTVKATDGDIDALSKQYVAMAGNVKDIAALEKQYNTVVEEQLKLKDRAIAKLEAEQVAIIANKDYTEAQKKDLLEQNKAKIKQIQSEKKIYKAKQNEAKLVAKTNNILKGNAKENSKQFEFYKKTIQLQEKLNSLLGKESKLRKAAAKVGQVGLKAGKLAGKAALGVAGIGAAVIGAGIAGAESIQEKEKALTSLKGGIQPTLVDELFVKTGAGYPEIVAALNNLSDLTKDGNELLAASQLELQYPGVGHAIITSSKNSGNLNAQQWQSTIAQIKKQTGTQDLSPAIEAAKANRLVTRGDVSQQHYLQAYSALASKGLDTETINRIIRHASKQGGNFLDNLNNLDLTKFVRGQDKQRLSGDKLNLTVINPDNPIEKTAATSVVEQMRKLQLLKDKLLTDILPIVAEVLTEIQNSGILKDVINGLGDLAKMITPLIIPLIRWLVGGFKVIMQGLEYVIQWAKKKLGLKSAEEKYADEMSEATKKTIDAAVRQGKDLDVIRTTLDVIAKHGLFGAANLAEYAASAEQRKYGSTYQQGILERAGYAYTPFLKEKKRLAANAQGGVVTTPSLCGEAGPELVIPLDNSRSGRASQIINNFNTNQSFNMQSNQQTPLAFAQSVGRNPFVKRFAYGN